MGRPKDLSEFERPDCDEWVNEERVKSAKGCTVGPRQCDVLGYVLLGTLGSCHYY